MTEELVKRALRDTAQVLPDVQQNGTGEASGFWSEPVARSDYLASWGTRQRERQLRAYDRDTNNTLWQGARSMLEKKFAGTPSEIHGGRNLARYFDDVLRYAEFGKGQRQLKKLVARDYLRFDGGAYVEVIAPGNPMRAPTGRVTGLAHLDSYACLPTGDPTYPVVYNDRKGKQHLLHHTRVLHFVDSPDGDQNNPGYGQCALSRAIAIVVRQIHMGRYVVAKLDDKPPPGMVLVSGMTRQTWNAAWQHYREEQNSDERPGWGKVLPLFGVDAAIAPKVESVPFASTPDKFDFKVYVELDVHELALTLGVDIQDLWELTGGNLGSSGQSEIQHAKSRGNTLGDMLSMWELAMNNQVLPEPLEYEHKTRDPYEANERAQNAQTWAGFVTAAGDALTAEEKRQILANQVEAVADAVIDGNGELIRLPDADRTSASQTLDVTIDNAAPATAGAVESDPVQLELVKEIQSAFVYIDLANDPALVELQKSLKQVLPADADIDWQIPATFHITLAYCVAATNKQLIRAAAAVAADPLPLRGSELGLFENENERALYLAIDKTPNLADLQNDIVFGFRATNTELSPFSEPSAYKPHITLCYLPPGIELPPIRANYSGLCQTVVFGRDEYQPFLTLNLSENNSKAIKDFDATRASFVSAFEDLAAAGLDGDLNRRRAGTVLRANISRLGRQSYADGLKEGGVEELSDDDLAAIAVLIAEQSQYATSFLNELFASGLTEAQISQHATMWANKTLTAFYQQGLASGDSNGLYEWVLGSAEHCADCLKMSGQKHRMREYVSQGILPKASRLECGGWQCACSLVKTAGRTKGAWL